MRTETAKIEDLSPGDKLYIRWSESEPRPKWHKLSDIVTVKSIENDRTVLIEESGGLCLQAKDFQRLLDLQEPESGDTITFKMEWFNDLKLKEYREFTEKVERISKDPMKKLKTKCIVLIENEEYGITFDMISKIEKTSKSQLELF